MSLSFGVLLDEPAVQVHLSLQMSEDYQSKYAALLAHANVFDIKVK